jgi:hypothetical protein
MAACLLLALGAAVYAPALLFFALPLLFGVPHVAADLRHLVLRRDLPASWRRNVWIGCAALLALRGLDAASPRTVGVETLLAVGWALLAIQAASEREPSAARTRVAVGVVLVAGLAALHYPRAARLLLLHAHNVVALLAAAFVFRARSRALWGAGLASVGVAVLLASGVLFRVTLSASSALQTSWLPVQLSEIADQVAPGLRGDRAIGVASAFLFLQALHYVIWLGVIPLRDGARERWSSLRKDFGNWGLAAIAGASAAVIGAGVLQPRVARALYLSLAGFHVYLELVMLLYFWVARGSERRASGEGAACRH